MQRLSQAHKTKQKSNQRYIRREWKQSLNVSLLPGLEAVQWSLSNCLPKNYKFSIVRNIKKKKTFTKESNNSKNYKKHCSPWIRCPRHFWLLCVRQQNPFILWVQNTITHYLMNQCRFEFELAIVLFIITSNIQRTFFINSEINRRLCSVCNSRSRMCNIILEHLYLIQNKNVGKLVLQFE